MDDKVRVLVTDDERPIREGCHRVLTGKGYEVLLAENGRLALEVLEKEQVDILLLDLKMPVLGGEEVLETVRTRYPKIPVIIITGHGTVDTAVECMKKGAYDFITKPFQLDPFLIVVQRAADKRRLEEKARLFEEERGKNLYDLAIEKSRVTTIIHCMASGVMVTNRNMEIVLHNPALTRLLEISGKTAPPFPAREIVKEESLLKTLERMVCGEVPEKEAKVQEIASGNRSLRAVSAPLLGPETRVVGTVTVLEDITDFKQLDQMKSDFLNMVAHELRSPLVAVRQLNSVLLDGLAGPLEEKPREFVSRGTKKIDTLLDLIKDLLDVAKIEAGKFVEHRTPTDIVHLLRDLIALMEPRAKSQGVELSCSFEDLKPIYADPKSMEEIFNNLISNALNYSPDGGTVRVTARTMGDYLEVRVEDTGVGISPEEVPKIFDKFYRVKHPKTRKVAGTGLGLAIVKGAIEAHQGSIEVESVPDRGTTFRVLLPVLSQPLL